MWVDNKLEVRVLRAESRRESKACQECQELHEATALTLSLNST